MSAKSKHSRNHNQRNASKCSAHKNTSNAQSIANANNPNYLIAVLAKTPQTQAFEEQQLKYLQTMLNYLADQILSSMNKQDGTDQKAMLTLFRVYAQYLNLYMKFMDKCFKDNKPSSYSASTQNLTSLTTAKQPEGETLEQQIEIAVKNFQQQEKPLSVHPPNGKSSSFHFQKQNVQHPPNHSQHNETKDRLNF